MKVNIGQCVGDHSQRAISNSHYFGIGAPTCSWSGPSCIPVWNGPPMSHRLSRDPRRYFQILKLVPWRDGCMLVVCAVLVLIGGCSQCLAFRLVMNSCSVWWRRESYIVSVLRRSLTLLKMSLQQSTDIIEDTNTYSRPGHRQTIVWRSCLQSAGLCFCGDESD